MILAIQTYPGANKIFEALWPHFLKSGASDYLIVTTNENYCWTPPNVLSVKIGPDRYISDGHLPNRLIETLAACLSTEFSHICVCEYDVLFRSLLPYQQLENGMAAHHAGGKPWELKCNYFLHNPWLFTREAAQQTVEGGRQLLEEREYVGGSPDCFIGWLTERFAIPVRTDLWKEYSRNDLTLPGHLEEARQAYRNGVDVIHGCKTEAQLDFILS